MCAKRTGLRCPDGLGSCVCGTLCPVTCPSPACNPMPPSCVRVAAGDLVTLPWWTEAWLTEGFARYFERIAAGFFWNSYDKSALPTEFTAAGPLTYMHAFVAEVLDPALTADALPSTTALSRPEAAVQSEADAQAAFGRVALDKGASVLRMLHAHMLRVAAAGGPEEAAWQVRRRLRDAAAPPPEDPFFNALRGYLEAYKFGTGHTDTLLEAMETETGMPLPLWAQGWAKREGSPMLMASRAQGQLRIEQFRQGGAHSEEAEAWWLPLTYHSIGWFGASADPEGGVPWLEMNATVAAVPWPEDAEAVKVNAGQLGAFRCGPAAAACANHALVAFARRCLATTHRGGGGSR